MQNKDKIQVLSLKLGSGATRHHIGTTMQLLRLLNGMESGIGWMIHQYPKSVAFKRFSAYQPYPHAKRARWFASMREARAYVVKKIDGGAL